MKRTIFFCCFCFGLVLNSQQYQAGVVLDSLPVLNTKNETFALYLPTSYKPDELSPILFIFSPSGNGKNGIKVFEKAAEKYNYILVCSNNSHNGPFDRNLGIAKRLFNHIFTSFNVNENRIYLTGFSGGSRLAIAIATLSGQFQGVIACGAGFPPVPSYQPSTQDFYYAGICGDRDMNFREMLDDAKYLNRLKFQNTFFTFQGNHMWPPNEQILMAFEWFEIEAHKKGLLKKSKSEINASYLKNHMLATSAITDNQPLMAAERYKRLLNVYGVFFDLDSVQQDLQTLKKSDPYTNTLNLRQKAFEKEASLSEKLIRRYLKDFDNPGKANLKWWNKELAKLDKLNAKANLETDKMLERLQFLLFATAYETTDSKSDATTAQKEFRKMIISEMRDRLYRKNVKEKS